MKTYVLAPDAALVLLEPAAPPGGGHTLMAPAVLRSHLLERLYDEVRRGAMAPQEAVARMRRLPALGLRLLGDSVLQRTALTLALELELPAWGLVEYVALTKLHADALITADAGLLEQQVVPVESVAVLG